MSTVHRTSGITVSTPSTYRVADEAPTAAARRRAAAQVEEAPLESELIAALGELELSHVYTIPLTPTRTA